MIENGYYVFFKINMIPVFYLITFSLLRRINALKLIHYIIWFNKMMIITHSAGDKLKFVGSISIFSSIFSGTNSTKTTSVVRFSFSAFFKLYSFFCERSISLSNSLAWIVLIKFIPFCITGETDTGFKIYILCPSVGFSRLLKKAEFSHTLGRKNLL